MHDDPTMSKHDDCALCESGVSDAHNAEQSETVERSCALCDEPIYVHVDSDRADSSYLRCDDGQGCSLWIADATAIGRAAGESAASWTADGNTTDDHIRTMAQFLADEDPSADDFLPAYPSLSGEWSGDPTPLSLARDVTGLDDPSTDLVDILADAFECGVAETFRAECERIIGERFRQIVETDADNLGLTFEPGFDTAVLQARVTDGLCDGLGTIIGTIPGRNGETGYYACSGCNACENDEVQS